MRPDRLLVHVGEPVSAAWGALPSTVTHVQSADAEIDDADGDENGPAVAVVRLSESEHESKSDIDLESEDEREKPDRATARLTRIRERYPNARILAYTVDDDPDAAIDASRLGAEYVSGRRLVADDETLAERIDEIAAGSGKTVSSAAESGSDKFRDDTFLEQFVRITSDQSTDLEGKLDALLDLGRERLGLSIGYTSRTTEDQFSLSRHRGGTELINSLIENDIIDADGSLPLERTYCRRTVGTDGGSDAAASGEELAATGVENTDSDIVSFTDPIEAGWDGDPAHELFGFGSYIGGRVVVDGEVFGSLCFVDREQRSQPFTEIEQLFVELLTEWLGRAFERRGAREQREAAVKQLEATIERIDDAFFALDEEWQFTYVNSNAATLLDRSVEELLGEDVWEAFPEAIGQTYETNYRRAMDEQETVSFEDRYEPLDLWTEVTAYPSPDGLSVFFSDITDRKRREETLERLLRTVERLQRDEDTAAVVDRLIDATDEILGYGLGAVRLFDEDAGVLRLVATSDGVGDRFEGRELRSPGEGIVGEIYESGEPQVWTDLADRTDDRKYHGMRSLVGVRLGDHGVFVVGSVEPDAFGESDVSVVELLAMNATATLDAQRRQERLQTYENALKNVDDMVCVLDADGIVTYATEPFIAWIGTDGANLIGRPLHDVLPGRAAERVADAFDRIHDGSSGWSDAVERIELSVDGGDGDAERRGEIRLSALSEASDGVVASLSDTTDLHRTRTKLSAERRRFDQLFERLPDPVIEVALEPNETIITGINPAFGSQFGYDESELRGRTISALAIHDDRIVSVDSEETDGGTEQDRPEPPLDERVRKEGFVTAEVHRRTVDGPREFLFRGFTYETDGERRAFGIYTDITDRKRRERYFRVVNRILRHNLRNELNVVFGFASEIATITADETVADYAQRIETTGKRLADVAEGAASIKRVVEEGLVSEPDAVSVADVVETVQMRYADTDPGTQIEVDVADDATIRGDERFEEAIDHLVENAIDHARAETPQVKIAAEHDRNAGIVTVTVADDGPGIPEPVRAVITGEMKVTQLTHNTGIGLWIVAWVVEAYGGTIAFGPGIDGNGTTVTLRLPAAE